jgi:hypothetical protein
MECQTIPNREFLSDARRPVSLKAGEPSSVSAILVFAKVEAQALSSRSYWESRAGILFLY